MKACWQDTAGAKKGEVTVDAKTEFQRVHERTKKGRQGKRTKLQATKQSHIEPAADNVKVLRHVYPSEATATRAARSAWEKLQCGVEEFNITLARGNAELMPEVPVRESGFKPVIDDTQWLAASVEHTINGGQAGNADRAVREVIS
ncbi:hypothetical protein [Vogesella indigofera]|uniref:hypothetical protein n=1 Tax=Vogesella indigofera TaxID=45465 RepID=UPI00234CA381|nr:hypothetical protein [Vogesella indigofera]MDC7704819.1 hypothetical protein [Vogesella indigofera]